MPNSVINSVIAGTGTFLLLHVAVWRARPSNSPRMFLLFLLAATGAGISVIVDVWLTGFRGLELFAVLCFELSAITLYFFVYAGLARSVSITLLSWLLSSGDRLVTLDTLADRYESSSRFEDRIRLMHNSGFLVLSDNSATLTRKGAALAHLAKALGRVIGDGLRG